MITQKPNIQTILLYPNLLNPLALLVATVYLIYFLMIFLFTTKDHRRRVLREVFHGFAVIVINTFWRNVKKSVAFAHYLKSLYLPFHPRSDWRTQKAIDVEYNYYKKVR